MKNSSKMIIGTFCMAVATNTVFQPLGIVTGGFSGLGIILFRMLGIPLWLVNTVLNVPFFVRRFTLISNYKAKSLNTKT